MSRAARDEIPQGAHQNTILIMSRSSRAVHTTVLASTNELDYAGTHVRAADLSQRFSQVAATPTILHTSMKRQQEVCSFTAELCRWASHANKAISTNEAGTSTRHHTAYVSSDAITESPVEPLLPEVTTVPAGCEHGDTHERKRLHELDRENQHRRCDVAQYVNFLVTVRYVGDCAPDGWSDNRTEAWNCQQNTDFTLGERVAVVVDHEEHFKRDKLRRLAGIEQEQGATPHCEFWCQAVRKVNNDDDVRRSMGSVEVEQARPGSAYNDAESMLAGYTNASMLHVHPQIKGDARDPGAVSHFSKPFFITCLDHSITILLLPALYIFHRVREYNDGVRTNKWGIADVLQRHSVHPLRKLLKIAVMLNSVYLIADYIWFTALGMISVAAGTSIGNTAPFFVYLFSMCFLHERASWKKLCGVLVSFVGVALVALYQDGAEESAKNTSVYMWIDNHSGVGCWELAVCGMSSASSGGAAGVAGHGMGPLPACREWNTGWCFHLDAIARSVLDDTTHYECGDDDDNSAVLDLGRNDQPSSVLVGVSFRRDAGHDRLLYPGMQLAKTPSRSED
ncbi:hypothetical protein ON010_g2872 [Phytophthora cinnamomi]|nr:hypothetical protein ON010_g2872 [Phytophthora cinnamomi]